MMIPSQFKFEQPGRKWDLFGEMKVATVSKRGLWGVSRSDPVLHCVLSQKKHRCINRAPSWPECVYIFSLVGSGPPAPSALPVWEERL